MNLVWERLYIREAKALENKKVRLAWEFPSEVEKQITGFIISRSHTPDGLYIDVSKKAVPKDKRDFIDETTSNNTYYILKAIDKEGMEVSRSFPYLVQFDDNTPPAIPIELEGVIEESGVAQLSWKPNTDLDLLGYRIFKSNSLTQEFVEITKDILSVPSFVDSVNIRVLNKKVYYNVIAVDKNYNTSDYSKPLTLTRPDIIPPAPPVFTKIEVGKENILVEWINSTSGDVARCELSRRSKSDQSTRVMQVWYPSSTSETYTDKHVDQQKLYQYILTVYDSAGNFSEVKSREVFYETGYRSAVTDVKVGVDREAKHIDFRWINESSAVKCLIYRRKNDEPLTLYQTVEGNIENFKDKHITINNSYEYKVQLIFQKGVKSILSEGVKIEY